MSWRDAPLYVRAHDLARDLLPRIEDGPHAALRHRLAAEVQALLCEIALALSFVEGRRQHQHAADEAITRLKVLVRLARDTGVIPERGARHVGEQLVEMGRMIGGWQRRSAGPPSRGEAPSPAPGV